MNEGRRIVLVEDDGIIAMDLAELLMSMGHDVCAIAGTQVEAMAAVRRFHPDLMIVDGQLPDGSGVAVMRRILEAADMAHFYVTGDPWAVRTLAPDAIVVTKPFTLRDLQRGIAKACDDVRLRLKPV